MHESFKNKRLKFSKKGHQRDFILTSKKSLNFTWIELSNKLNVSQRTLADWTREKFNISQDGAIKISQLVKKPIKGKYKIVELKDHLRKIGKEGGKNRFYLYGKVTLDEEYRNKKWKEWWNKTGQHKKIAQGFQSIIKIRTPRNSYKLAEFIGIMLGDGGVAPYHIHITLSNKEKEYSKYVSNLVTELFGVVPKLRKLKYANAVNIVIQRKQLVDFCQKVGLVKGNKIKQKIDIPEWIKKNKKFAKACLMGLIDTDGCFFTNSYFVNEKKYSYFKIAFTNGSLPLIKSVGEILNNFGISTRTSKRMRQNGWDIRIERLEHVKKYINEIGSHNQKHLDKIKNFYLLELGGVGGIRTLEGF